MALFRLQETLFARKMSDESGLRRDSELLCECLQGRFLGRKGGPVWVFLRVVGVGRGLH